MLKPVTTAVVAQPHRCASPPRFVFLLAWGCAVSIVFSIAVSQILLAAGLIALLATRHPLRLPPLKWQIALWFATVIASDLLSGDPTHGLPQIRKLYVFLVLVLVCSTFETLGRIRALVLGWGAVAAVSALCGIAQFAVVNREAVAEYANDYEFFLYHRITGFAGHWMTFGGQEMIALVMLASLLLFSRDRRLRLSCLTAGAVILAAIVIGLTRSILLAGVPAGVAYLLWRWKKWLVAAIPLTAAALFLCAPFQVRERIASALEPLPQYDSNAQRALMMRTGWSMFRAHPWFGLGPEQIAPHFEEYVPPDIPRPLPQGWYGHLHNIYLQYAAERGILGLAAVLWFIASVLADFSFAAREAGPESRFVLHGAVGVIIALLCEGLFEHNLGDSEILTMFLIVVACGYIARDCANQNDQARLV